MLAERRLGGGVICANSSGLVFVDNHVACIRIPIHDELSVCGNDSYPRNVYLWMRNRNRLNRRRLRSPVVGNML